MHRNIHNLNNFVFHSFNKTKLIVSVKFMKSRGKNQQQSKQREKLQIKKKFVNFSFCNY